MTPKAFQKKIWEYYAEHERDLPWRRTHDAYRILVSEMMLQQTQVDRVIPKYQSFIKKFPTIAALAKAPLHAVLEEWSGLGYNRRALYLKRAAEMIVREYRGKIPKDITLLERLPGVGPYTARAIAVFAYDTPQVFIETNIRSVYIHEFFPLSFTRRGLGRGELRTSPQVPSLLRRGGNTQIKISDKELLPLIEKTLPVGKSRQWYYALMDYGSALKKEKGNPSKRSAEYAKQSLFKGSLRELRGAVVRHMVSNKKISKTALKKRFGKDVRYSQVVDALADEGFIRGSGGFWEIC